MWILGEGEGSDFSLPKAKRERIFGILEMAFLLHTGQKDRTRGRKGGERKRATEDAALRRRHAPRRHWPPSKNQATSALVSTFQSTFQGAVLRRSSSK